MLRLLTIPLSHYCERARWALDLLVRAGGVGGYEEEQHLQTFHWRPVKDAGARHTVPVLLTDAHVLTDSEHVLRWVDARLPAARRLFDGGAGEALSTRLAGELGVESRRWAYDYFFRAPVAALTYNDGHAPRWERALLRLFRPAIEPRMKAYLGVEPERTRAALELVRATFDDVARVLSDGRPYLAGDRFGVADLTFATMSSPALLPPGYGQPFPPLEQIPADARAVIEELRAHPAGRHALRMFAEERPPVAATFV